jgi:hypothetical protein
MSKHFTIQFSYLGKPSNILDNSPAIHGCYHIGDERVALPPTSLTIAQPFMAAITSVMNESPCLQHP